MPNINLTNTNDLSLLSKEELLDAMKQLQLENQKLRSKIQPESPEEDSKQMSFRQQYAEKILDALPDMLTVVTDNGTTVAVVSSEETNHSGIAREDIFGVPVRDFLPDHVYDHVMLSIDQAIEHGQSENLSHVMYVDDKPHYYENRTVRIDHDYNLCVCRDITEEMRAKIQLESLNYAVNLVNENIFSLNQKGEFTFANKQFLRDHQQNNIIGKPALGTIFSFKTADQWEELKQKVHDNDGETTYILEHKYTDGRVISYEIVVHSVRNINNDEEFWFFARNITERIQQEHKIKELNALMDAILSNIPIYLFVKDTTDLRYIYWNKALEERTGVSAEKAIGKTDEELFPDMFDAAQLKENDLELVKHNVKTEYIEEFINTSGQNRIVKTVKVPMIREDKDPLIIGVAIDITDIKMVEKELIAAKIEAEKSNHLKSAFLANMSHEIRTPLNAIVGFAKLIMTEEDPQTRQEFSSIIDSNADMLLQLINDILDLSKIEAGTLDFTFKEVNLSELCGEMLEVHRMKTPEGVSLYYDDPETDLIIESDKNRLAQVFTNLLSNAIKFTTSGEIRFGYTVNGDNVEGFVSDTGMGISKEKLPTIFDRFIKLNSFVAGTGLGLSITKTIIERLGGTIWVTSVEGEGTEFRFSIPYKNCSAHYNADLAISEISKMSSLASAPNKSILVAEDSDSNYMLIKRFIGDKYTHYHAKNGNEAIEMFKKYSPSLILMDIKMPLMDGLEATKAIRKLSADVPIVALTAFAYDSDKESAIEAGCNFFLAKPLCFNLLQPIIDKYIDKRLE